MKEEDPSKLAKDFRRIDSINIGTPGHWWSSYESKKSFQAPEIDPGKLNLNKPQDFLIFLKALGNGENRSLNFLEKIPPKRMEELKKIHAQFEIHFGLLRR